jgi:hypothetical protein
MKTTIIMALGLLLGACASHGNGSSYDHRDGWADARTYAGCPEVDAAQPLCRVATIYADVVTGITPDETTVSIDRVELRTGSGWAY